jgi:NADH-quinone oxidoreductase subunit G
LKSAVAGAPVRTAYSDLESAPAVLLVAFEPEDESPIVFLRLRKAAAARTKVLSIAATATRGLEKMKGTWIPAAPGAEAAAIGALDAAVLDQLRQSGAVILVGERIASIAGGASAVQALAASTGAALAWVPRRAGERGALDAGALAGLLPLGRPLTDAAARSEVAAAWGVSADSLPTQAGLSGEQLLLAAKARTIRAIISGGVDLGDFANPALAREAFESTGFVLSLENHHSSVTAIADVVLPVAVVTEKSGTFINWEGRPRPFGEVLRDALMMSDAAVLGLVAQSLGANVGASDVPALRRQMASLGAWQGSRESAPSVAPAAGRSWKGMSAPAADRSAASVA